MDRTVYGVAIKSPDDPRRPKYMTTNCGKIITEKGSLKTWSSAAVSTERSGNPIRSAMDILTNAQTKFCRSVLDSVKSLYDVEIPSEMETILFKSISRPRTRGQGEFMFPCSSLCKLVTGPKPSDLAIALSEHINQTLRHIQPYSEVFESTSPNGVYVNLKLQAKYFGSVLNAINHGTFLDPLPRTTQEKVMIEYSQPNTHKAFHVGHMRNVALGGSIIRLYEQMGHEVIAANYLGDEGAHVSKCLWLLCQRMKQQQKTIEQLDVPVDRKGEYLGKLYAEANDLLDLRSLTRYPYPNIIAARVLTKSNHPSADAPPNWHLCTVDYGAHAPATVVCGGIGYEAGDMIAYIPVGSKLKKQLIAPRDMKGVTSCGMMLAYSELGATAPAKRVQLVKASMPVNEESSAKGKGKNKKASASSIETHMIMVLEEDCQPGELLVEIGKLDKTQSGSVSEEHKRKKAEVDDVLRKLETGDHEMTDLWKKTKQWSFDDFKAIYHWLEARFDHYFFESEVSEESRHLVFDNYKLSPEEGGVMTESNGAIGCDLTMFNLPFLILIKSNGAGLYATKDLSLAQRKFRDFQIERSIYIVDSAQTLHFQQVFACLERLGYQQAKKCFHLSYGQVVGPNGKMSSRDGTVIYFNDLKEQLANEIMSSYLEKYKGVWDIDEILNVQHQIALATIKYRMLNQDPIKDIVFVLKDWTAKTGDTGPYLCYAYARIKAIMAKADKSVKGKVDLSLLNSDHDRSLLYAVNSFWSIVEKSAYEYKPNTLCKYLYELSKDLNSWYEVSPVNTAETDDLKATRLEFIAAIGAIIKKGLFLLGINAVERM